MKPLAALPHAHAGHILTLTTCFWLASCFGESEGVSGDSEDSTTMGSTTGTASTTASTSTATSTSDSGTTEGTGSAGTSTTSDGSTGPSTTDASGSTGDVTSGSTTSGSTGSTGDAGSSTGNEAFKRIVFLATEAGAPGSYGGLAGADAICQARADAESLPGTYMAWLSANAANSPDTRFNKAGGPFVLVDDVVVADDWDDLTDGTLDNMIRTTETGTNVMAGMIVARSVVTNTNADGTAGAVVSPCVSYNLTADDNAPTRGDALTTDAGWTESANTRACNYTTSGGSSLYCFQQ